MKIAVITDIHHAPHVEDGFDALPTLQRFVADAEGWSADLLLDLGDRIDDIDYPTDVASLEAVARCLEQFSGPRVHLQGNHDVVNLSPEENARRLGQPTGNHTVDLGEARLIVWQPSVRFTRPVGFPPAADNLDWLVETLLGDTRPAIVATHIPVSGAAMTGNFHFANNPGFATYPDHARIRDAVEATGRAAVWLSGHVHWNSVTVVGALPHLTVQSVSERFTTMPDPARCYAVLGIGDDSVRLAVHGADPMLWEAPFRASGRRPWPRPRAVVR